MGISRESIETCIDVAKRFGAERLVLFGTAASDPASARDIDLICRGVSGWDLLRMAAEMENRTGTSVDVVEERQGPFVQYNLEHGRVLYERG